MEYTKIPNKNRNINNINENPSPRTVRKGSNPYKKRNNKLTNSKYFSSNKKHKINDYTLDSESNKVLFYTEEENKTYQNLANNIIIQNKILEEYQIWVKLYCLLLITIK